MITLINATNRPDNQTQLVADVYLELLKNKGNEVRYLSMQELPFEYLKLDSRKTEEEKTGMAQVIQTFIAEADKIIVISPEYQGSFTGIFKLFLDFVRPDFFYGKKIALVGVSKGRAGNLRGLDHLTNIFNYLQANVLAQKLPISTLQNLVKDGKLSDEGTLKAIEKQLDYFEKF